MKNNYLKSPLNYIGGKYKLLPQILPYFPKEINTFVDLFSGGVNVAINIDANKVICNDINSKIIELFQAFQSYSVQDILSHIENRIQEYGLSKTNENGFLTFRKFYNQTHNPLDMYVLACYSFNYQFRFNSQYEYNNPFGRNHSSFSLPMKNNLIAFVQKLQASNFLFSVSDFNNFDISHLNNRDMIYCDPPYLITTGSYNDGNRGFKGWGIKDDEALYAFLDEIHNKGIRFALSNVTHHKGKVNEILLDWIKKYRTIELKANYSNSSHNTTRGESKEVLVINYE